jgi:hypothetical protein
MTDEKENRLRTLARLLIKGDRVNALRLINRVLKEPRSKLIEGKRRFWEQMQFELKKPDDEPIEIHETKNRSYFVDPSRNEFIRIIMNNSLSDSDFAYLMNYYENKAELMSHVYFGAKYRYLMLEITQELRSKKK